MTKLDLNTIIYKTMPIHILAYNHKKLHYKYKHTPYRALHAAASFLAALQELGSLEPPETR